MDEKSLLNAIGQMMDSKLEPINQRLGNLEAGQARLEADVSGLKAGQTNLEAKFDKLEAKVDKLAAGQIRIESKVNKLDSDVSDVKYELMDLKREHKDHVFLTNVIANNLQAQSDRATALERSIYVKTVS